MESKIYIDAPLDYVEFQLIPGRDRYEACACSGDIIETIACGLLGQLVLHIPRVKDLFSRGSKASFQIQCPKDDSSFWFTKATVTRYLHIVGSMNIINTSSSLQDEITQLEEAKRFHLSLYTKDESETTPSDASKNELLRAIELRLTSLRKEIATIINRAAGSSCIPKDICNMEKLAQHLGDIKLRNTFAKLSELRVIDQKIDLQINSNIDRSDEKNEADKLSGLDKPAKYGLSPAKAAQTERQRFTKSEKSPDSSEDDSHSVERSTSLARPASHRRSASPMRRVQIGRSGSRRATALTIKSLNYLPSRDKSQPYGDADASSSEEVESKKPPKRSDSNALRISVKDAINLFENRKDNTSDAQKRRSTLDVATGTNKSVLRRWSSGFVDPKTDSEGSSQLSSGNGDIETSRHRVEENPAFEIIHGENKPVEDANVGVFLHATEEIFSKPIDSQPDILVIQYEEDNEKVTDSSEWNQQKEAELNKIFTKMMRSKPRRTLNAIPDKNGPQNVLREKRGGFYDQYKGKRDVKLKGETAVKLAEKDAQSEEMQQVVQRHAAMVLVKTTVASRSKSSLSKPEKLRKSLTQSVNPKKESPKPDLAMKASSPSSVRKSWSSTPSPRATMGISPAKTPCGNSFSGTTPTRRKPLPGPTGSQPSLKVERTSQGPKPKFVKATQTDSRKSAKSTVKKQLPISKNMKSSKPISLTISKESSKDVAKPNFYTKVTKKSSVVPLESKPFLLKGCGVSPDPGPVAKMKASSPPKEPEENPENPIPVEKNKVATDTIDLVCQQIADKNLESDDTCADLQPEVQLTAWQLSGDISNCKQVITNSDDNLRRMSDPELIIETGQDSTISPTAWVEKEEQEDSCIPSDDNTCKTLPFLNVGTVATASSRVRHSLSQMLLQENELDLAEWGSAAIPPSLGYQKDAPKGLKRLLKFARKSKGDQGSTGWSSPSVFSEGEDDAEDYKAFCKKNTNTSLRKAAFHASNNGHQKTLLGEVQGKDFAGPQRLYDQLKLDNFGAQSSSNRVQDHISGATTTNKETRSFFSLSAFRGKQTK